MKYLIVLPLIALFLVSCKNYEGHRYGNINASQKQSLFRQAQKTQYVNSRTNYVKTDGNYGYPVQVFLRPCEQATELKLSLINGMPVMGWKYFGNTENSIY